MLNRLPSFVLRSVMAVSCAGVVFACQGTLLENDDGLSDPGSDSNAQGGTGGSSLQTGGSTSTGTGGVGTGGTGLTAGGAGGVGAGGVAGSGGSGGVGGSGGTGSTCAVGLSQCPSACVNLTNDPLNCGTCGNVCPAGQVCTNSACACPPGLTDCGGTCVDLTSDPNHCGACPTVCPVGQVCSQSACGVDCADNLLECNGACVDPQTSELTCGNCQTACAAEQTCESGSCQCPPGENLCGSACVNFSNDSQYCGNCQTSCGGGQTCSSGSCVCPNQGLFCGGQCRNGQTDPAHCGTCNNACASGSCNNGTCTPVAPTDTVIGWAAWPGHGRDTTTGGQGGSTIDVDTAGALTSAATSGTTQIIRLTASVSVAELNINSNKTLIGVGTNIVLSGGININGKQNIIIKNIRINAASSDADGDGIHIQNSHHVWVDHCDIYNAPDGNLDINDSSDNITVSWTRFYYNNPPDPAHRFSNLIGSGDGVSSDAGKLNVTFHHNWWAQNVHERMPRVRFGKVHVFNNYFSSSGNNYCIRAGHMANIRVENNVFENVDSPHEIDSTGSSNSNMSASGNIYTNTTGAQQTRGTAFTPPYPYTSANASTIKSAVMNGYGPR